MKVFALLLVTILSIQAVTITKRIRIRKSGIPSKIEELNEIDQMLLADKYEMTQKPNSNTEIEEIVWEVDNGNDEDLHDFESIKLDDIADDAVFEMDETEPIEVAYKKGDAVKRKSYQSVKPMSSFMATPSIYLPPKVPMMQILPVSPMLDAFSFLNSPSKMPSSGGSKADDWKTVFDALSKSDIPSKGSLPNIACDFQNMIGAQLLPATSNTPSMGGANFQQMCPGLSSSGGSKFSEAEDWKTLFSALGGKGDQSPPECARTFGNFGQSLFGGANPTAQNLPFFGI